CALPILTLRIRSLLRERCFRTPGPDPDERVRAVSNRCFARGASGHHTKPKVYRGGKVSNRCFARGASGLHGLSLLTGAFMFLIAASREVLQDPTCLTAPGGGPRSF